MGEDLGHVKRIASPLILPPKQNKLREHPLVRKGLYYLVLAGASVGALGVGCSVVQQRLDANADRDTLRALKGKGFTEPDAPAQPSDERIQRVGQILRISHGGREVRIACSDKKGDYLDFGHRVNITPVENPKGSSTTIHAASSRKPTTTAANQIAKPPGAVARIDVLYEGQGHDVNHDERYTQEQSLTVHPVDNRGQVAEFVSSTLPSLCKVDFRIRP